MLVFFSNNSLFFTTFAGENLSSFTHLLKNDNRMSTIKKLMTLLLALVLPVTAMALPPYSYTNYDFEEGGIYYKIVDNEAWVTFQEYRSGMHLSDSHGDLIIPAQVTYQDVTYPVTTIDYYAFNYCQGLTSISIPASINRIKDCAFYLCTGLTHVELLCSNAVIEEHAFSMCTGLEKITCPLMTPPVMYYEDCFDSPHFETVILLVPAAAVESYRNAPVWEKFVHIQPIDNLPGDVNGDGEITIADANGVIDIVVMGGNGGHTRMPAMDMNDDGEVTVADVNSIIDIILSNK